MKRFTKLLGFVGLASLLIGCGGNLAKRQDTGCGGAFSGATFTVNYGPRSRSGALSSDLSGIFVITNGAPAGGNLTYKFGRNSTLAAHAETYQLPPVSTSATSGTLTLYADAGQSGAVVGTATTAITASCASVQVGTFVTSAAVSQVAVTPGTVTVGGSTLQLTFTAKDAQASTVVVTPGSAVFSSTGSAATVTKDGIVTPVSQGSVSVTATVDGVTSPAVTVTVNPKQSSGPNAYKLVDLGPSALIPNYSQVAPSEMGRRINDSSKCVIYDVAAKEFYVVDATNPSSRTLLSGSSDQTLLFAIGSKGDVIGENLDHGAVYWGAGSYGSIASLKGTDAGPGTAISTSGSAVGAGLLNPYYWPTLSSPGVAMALTSGSSLNVYPKDINASGLIVGYTTSNDTVPPVAVYYSSNSSKPVVLQAGGQTNYVATACNDSGVIVGNSYTQYGAEGMLWPSPTSNPIIINGGLVPMSINNNGVVVGYESDFGTGVGTAYVYTQAAGNKELYGLCDSSRTGWTLNFAIGVNSKGVILGQGTISGVVHTFAAFPNQ